MILPLRRATATAITKVSRIRYDDRFSLLDIKVNHELQCIVGPYAVWHVRYAVTELDRFETC